MGPGVGAGVRAGAVVSCVVSSGVVDDVDDACMDGSALDVIRPGSNSVIQNFSEYHDSSCARLNALQNSHLECGRHVHGGMKRSSTGSLCKVRLSAGKKLSFSQQQPRKVHDEVWAGLLKKQGPLSSRRWKSFRGVLSPWLVLRVLITLLCHLGQVELFGTCWVGHSWRKQLGLAYGCFVVPSKGRVFSLPLSQQETGFGRGRTAQRGRSLFVLRVLVRMRYGQGPAIRPNTGERCWPLLAGVWRAILHP